MKLAEPDAVRRGWRLAGRPEADHRRRSGSAKRLGQGGQVVVLYGGCRSLWANGAVISLDITLTQFVWTIKGTCATVSPRTTTQDWPRAYPLPERQKTGSGRVGDHCFRRTRGPRGSSNGLPQPEPCSRVWPTMPTSKKRNRLSAQTRLDIDQAGGSKGRHQHRTGGGTAFLHHRTGTGMPNPGDDSRAGRAGPAVGAATAV